MSGGKGGSDEQTIGYKYHLGLHAILCHGPVDRVTRFTVDDKTAWSGSSAGGAIQVSAEELFGGEAREGGVSGVIDIEMGGPTQGRNSYLQSQLGASIPAFRRVLGLVFHRFYLGNNPYLKRWSIRATRIMTRQGGLPQWNAGAANIAGDMNPAHIIRECLTDLDWGMGYPEGDIDDASFSAAASTLLSEGLGISLLWDKQQGLNDFLALILRHIDGSLYTNLSTGKFVLKLARGGYTASALPLLDESVVARISDFKRATISELTNQVNVIFWDKSTGKDNSVTVQDIALAASQGGTVGVTLQYPGLTNGTIAAKIAARDLKALSNPIASATLYVTRRAASLNIGDVFRFAWAAYGISQVVFRVMNIELGELTNNLIKLTVVEDSFALGSAVYAPPPPTEWLDPIGPPLPVLYRQVAEVPYYLLARAVGDAAAQAVPSTSSYLLIAGVRPSNSAISARVYVDDGVGYKQKAVLKFCPTVVTTEACGPGEITAIAISGGFDADLIKPDDFAIVYSAPYEILQIVAISSAAITCKRGMLDSTPGKIPSGSRLLVVGGADSLWASNLVTEYTLSESVPVRLLPTTGKGMLDIDSAPTDICVISPLAGRHSRPNPPGRLRVNGAAYPAEVSGPLTVSWAHRDRLQQTALIAVDQTAGNIGPEAGTTYTVRLYDQNNQLRRTVQGLQSTELTWTTEAIDMAEPVAASWSQSSTLPGLSPASQPSMTDGDFTTGSATVAGAPGWIQADLGASPPTVDAIALAAGEVGAFPVASALNGSAVEHSQDGLDGSWVAVASVSGVTDTNGLNIFSFSPVAARFWRLSNAAQVGASEFRLFDSSIRATATRIEVEAVRDSTPSLFKHDVEVGRQ